MMHCMLYIFILREVKQLKNNFQICKVFEILITLHETKCLPKHKLLYSS